MTETLKFISVGITRFVTPLFFFLYYQLFTNSDNFELTLLILTWYIFITAVIFGQLVNFAVINNLTISYKNSAFNMLTLFLSSLFLTILFNEANFIFISIITISYLNLKYEVLLLKTNRIVEHALSLCGRFFIPLVFIYVFYLIDLQEIYLIPLFFLISEICRFYILRFLTLNSINTLSNDFKHKFNRFINQAIIVIFVGSGILFIRTYSFFVFPNEYTNVDALLRFVELLTSVSTMYFAQRFQYALSINRFDRQSIFYALTIFLFLITFSLIIFPFIEGIQLIEQAVKSGPKLMSLSIILSLLIIGSVFSSKVFYSFFQSSHRKNFNVYLASFIPASLIFSNFKGMESVFILVILYLFIFILMTISGRKNVP